MITEKTLIEKLGLILPTIPEHNRATYLRDVSCKAENDAWETDDATKRAELLNLSSAAHAWLMTL